MKKLIGMLAVALIVSTASAQPYNVRGGFNGWGESQMNDDGDGTYSLTVGSLTPGGTTEFKIAFNDWAQSWPGSNAEVAIDAGGSITFHFRPGAIADGWNPGSDRVGYNDPLQFGWEIMGAFNGWNDGVDTAARQMTNMGGGLYVVNYTIAAPGTYDFKFRKSGSWDISIGGDFGDSAGNAQVTSTMPNELMQFALDLPNGRWRAIPEPMTITFLAGIAGLVASRRRAR